MADRPTETKQSAPKPSSAVLRRQLGDERDALTKDLDKLAGEVGDAVAAGRDKLVTAGRKARSAAPAVGGGLAALLVLRTVLRRRRRRS